MLTVPSPQAQRPRAVAQSVEVDLHAVEHRDPEVIQRGFLGVDDVAALLERAAGSASEDQREVVVVVGIAVGVAAAVGQHAVVQQRAVSLFDRVQLLQQVGQLLDVERVDVANLFHLGFVVAVV